MQSMAYPASIFRGGDGYYQIRFRDIPEALTDAPDLNNAYEAAVDCLAAALEGYILDRQALPAPSAPKRGEAAIPLPPLMAAKIALYQTMQSLKITNVALADKLNCNEKDIRRLLDLRHRSHIDAVERALEALGQRLVVSVMKAA